MGLGNRFLEGTKETCEHQDPGKGAVTPEKTDPDFPGSVQESPVETWVSGGLLQDWGH